MNKFGLRALALLCLLTIHVSAKDHKDHFEFSGISCDHLLQLLPKHPQDTQIAEGDLVLAIQQTASETEKKAAEAENRFSVWIFSQILGVNFNKSNLPITAAFFEELRSPLGLTIREIKEKFKRRRPVHFDNRIKNKLLSPTDDSYPSGHSANGLFWATILSDLRPELKDKIFEQGRRVGWHRIILGVHYPSDVTAGFYIGQYIANAVIKSSYYQTKRALILEEWRKQI